MSALELILIFMLQVEDISGGSIHFYHRAGGDVVLPCYSASPFYQCSNVSWFHRRNTDAQEVLVSSAQAARLSLDSKCSLVINDTTAEDAGLYTCLFEGRVVLDIYVYLSILTISSLDVDPTKNGNITLKCFLWRHPSFPSCPNNSIVWVNETGTELLGEDDGYKFEGQRDCISCLTVKHQSGSSRTFSCQFVEGSRVKIEAHYTPIYRGAALNSRSPLSSIMLTLRLTALILMIGLTVGIIRTRGSTKSLKDMNMNADGDTVLYEEIGEDSAASTLS